MANACGSISAAAARGAARMGRIHTRAQPDRRCVFVEREPGADDDPLKPPPGLHQAVPSIGTYGSWGRSGSPRDGPLDPSNRSSVEQEVEARSRTSSPAGVRSPLTGQTGGLIGGQAGPRSALPLPMRALADQASAQLHRLLARHRGSPDAALAAKVEAGPVADAGQCDRHEAELRLLAEGGHLLGRAGTLAAEGRRNVAGRDAEVSALVHQVELDRRLVLFSAE
jgi:hypothetical protein